MKLINKPKRFLLIVLTSVVISSSAYMANKVYQNYKEIENIDISLIEKPKASIIYDKNNNEIARLSKNNLDKYWQSNIKNDVKNAFISIEDKRFLNHNGVDYIRLTKVMIKRLLGSESGGASTITQQLVKNVFLTPERSMDRKIKEILLARKIEKTYSKDIILESYLNNIYFGNGNHGIKMAAYDYFGKEVNNLNLRESAMLAIMINNPEKYNVRKSMYKTHDMSKINKRTDLCLNLMRKNGYISESRLKQELANSVFIKNETTYFKKTDMYNHAHYVEYAINEAIISYLKSKNIYPSPKKMKIAKESFERKGFKIYTYLDTDLQNHVEDVIQNYKYPKLKNNNESAEVACIISENETGNIVAMVGSKDNPVQRWTYNRALQSKTPVASILKPIAIYGPAYDTGKNLNDLVLNEKTKIDGYDDLEMYPPGKLLKEGQVTYQFSMNHSLNIPAARILVDDVGYEKSYSYLHKLGIEDSEITKSGNGIVLGTSQIPLMKVLRGYQAIANYGVYVEQSPIKSIFDSTGKNIPLQRRKSIRVYTTEGSAKTKENLRSVVTDGTGYACNIKALEIYGKTGTHQDKVMDFAGFTDSYNGIVWIASDNNTSFKGEPLSQDYAAPLFSKIFKYFRKEY